MSEKEVHPKQRLHKYVGVLEAYYETGMEGCHMIMLHDDRGLKPGPKWDNPAEIMQYHSLEWAVVFDKRAYFAANIFDKEGNLVYEGKLTMDKKKVAAAKYAASFIPKEIDTKTWFKYIREEYRAEVFTNLVLDPIRKEYNVEFQAGDLVFDDLTSTDAIIISITLGTDPRTKTVGYWVNNDYLEGGRHPWEITKIDMIARWKAELEKQKKIEEEKKKNGNQND